MTFDEVVRSRCSTRAFESRVVEPALIREVLEIAQRSPSNCNVQPWRVWVVSGAKRDALSARLCACLDGGNWGTPEDPIDTFPGEYRRLQVECGAELYGKMGVARDDQRGRFLAHRRNYEFFDAPHIAIVAMDRHFGVGVALDVGTWIQTFMLGLESRGVSSIAQAALRHYPAEVREELGIPDSMRVLCGISFGYALAGAPANDVRQRREPLETNISFLE